MTPVSGNGGNPAARAPARVLVLGNPGRMSRHWIDGLREGATRQSIATLSTDTELLHQAMQRDPQTLATQIDWLCHQQGVIAVVGYVSNSIFALPLIRDDEDVLHSFFASRGVTELLFWSDHPQWSAGGAALRAADQTLYRQPTLHHFVKSEAAAMELRLLLGWPNCHAMLVAEDAEVLQPEERAADPSHDVVVVSGVGPDDDEEILAHAARDEPSVPAIQSIVAHRVRDEFSAIWDAHVPTQRRGDLDALADAWVGRRREEHRTASIRHLLGLRAGHEDAVTWLLANPDAYFAAARAQWAFGAWQRTFLIAYLSRFFDVGVYGADFRALGAGGDAAWVDNAEQPAVYARGRIALTVPLGHDEEGLTHKPFQIASSGVPMMHPEHVGLREAFTVGAEVETFRTPLEARFLLRELVADEKRREILARNARTRLVRDHTWSRRIGHMLTVAGLDPQQFRLLDEPVTPVTPVAA